MEDYIRMLVEEEFDKDELVEALRERIREELSYEYLAKLILENFDLEEIALELASDDLSLPF